MRKLLCISGALLFSVGAAAQTGVAIFSDTVLNKQLYLRGFSADEQVRGHWNGRAVVMDAPHVRTLGVFTANLVKMKGDKIQIQGDRQPLVREHETRVVMGASKNHVTIEVELRGADEDAVLAKLAGILFYANRAEALDDLPARYKQILPARADLTGAVFPPTNLKECDCADSTGCASDGVRRGMLGLKEPRLIASVEPVFSEEARTSKINGTVTVAFELDTDGKPAALWIVRGAGAGLDAKSADAVRQYVFHAATCHGTPVKYPMSIDVTFRIF